MGTIVFFRCSFVGVRLSWVPSLSGGVGGGRGTARPAAGGGWRRAGGGELRAASSEGGVLCSEFERERPRDGDLERAGERCRLPSEEVELFNEVLPGAR